MIRIGNGFDAHRLESGQTLIIGGVTIPFDKGTIAHSDGDVLIHAIVDALLGAAAIGDIGQHFPPSDPSFKDADSRHFLRHTLQLLANQDYSIQNIDSTIICEAPKLAPHILLMRQHIAADLSINLDQVSVKATTTEGMGYTGMGEGIAAQAVVLIKGASIH